MGTWDIYREKSDARGSTKRESFLKREARYLSTHTPDNLSYHTVMIDEEPQDVAVINSDNLNTKTIISMPGQDISSGSMVQWMDNHWLVTERDANSELYTKAKMMQCNFLLKWIDDLGVMHEQWCIIEDGTKLKCA